MLDSQKELLELLSISIYGTPCQSAPSGAVKKEAVAQAVYPFVSGMDVLGCKYLATNTKITREHAALHKLLTERSLPYVFLKGVASAFYYEKPSLRCMGDVDLYAAPDVYGAVKQLLLENGYVKEDENEHHECLISPEHVKVELHSEIIGLLSEKSGKRSRNQRTEEKVRACLATVQRDARVIQTACGETVIPSEFHHGLIMLLHVAGHMIEYGGIGLRHICDWAVYIRKVDFGQYRESYREMGLWNFACQLTALCVRFLGLPEPEWLRDTVPDDVFLDGLMEDIMSAGNFGHKDEVYKTASNLLTRDGMEEKSKLKQMLKSLVRYTRYNWKLADRYPILIPFGCLWFMIRYPFRQLKRKSKKFFFHRTLKIANDKKKLYSQFRLFRDREESD